MFLRRFLAILNVEVFIEQWFLTPKYQPTRSHLCYYDDDHE